MLDLIRVRPVFGRSSRSAGCSSRGDRTRRGPGSYIPVESPNPRWRSRNTASSHDSKERESLARGGMRPRRAFRQMLQVMLSFVAAHPFVCLCVLLLFSPLLTGAAFVGERQVGIVV